MANLYKKYKKSDIKNKDGGYKPRLLFAPIDTFLVCSLPGADTALGDDVKIIEDHTFADPDGFIEIAGKVHSAKTTYSTVGDAGSEVIEHKFIIVVEGNSPELYSMLRKLKSDESVFMLKDANCIAADSYEQYGDSCLTPTLTVEFDSATTAEGTKQHTLTGTIREHKYWYYGAVTEKP